MFVKGQVVFQGCQVEQGGEQTADHRAIKRRRKMQGKQKKLL